MIQTKEMAALFARLQPSTEMRKGFKEKALDVMRLQALGFGALPALVAALLLSPLLGFGALFAALWVPIGFLIALQRYRRLGLQISSQGLAFRNGFIGYRVVAHLLRKVQRVSVSQSPFQRRKGLASIRLYLASGTLKIPYLAMADAQALRDYILYKVEVSDRAWH